jgi:hypothetical protein
MSVLRAGAGSFGEVAVIHGTDAGVEGGRRAGASIVAGVLTGPHPARRLRSAGATHILESVAELPALPLAGDAAMRSGVAASENGDSGRIDVPAQVPFERRTSER